MTLGDSQWRKRWNPELMEPGTINIWNTYDTQACHAFFIFRPLTNKKDTERGMQLTRENADIVFQPGWQFIEGPTQRKANELDPDTGQEVWYWVTSINGVLTEEGRRRWNYPDAPPGDDFQGGYLK